MLHMNYIESCNKGSHFLCMYFKYTFNINLFKIFCTYIILSLSLSSYTLSLLCHPSQSCILINSFCITFIPQFFKNFSSMILYGADCIVQKLHNGMPHFSHNNIIFHVQVSYTQFTHTLLYFYHQPV